MSLGYKLPSGRSWTEELPPGGMSRSTMAFAADSGVRVLNIKINWLALAEAIKYIVGYSVTTPVFNPASPSAQGPYTLSRFPPARHPAWPNLRATRILSVTGHTPSRATGGGANAGAVYSGITDGTYGNWQYAYLSIQFEVPKYPIMSDVELQSAGIGVGTRPEYLRNHLWEFDCDTENLARRGETWAYCLGANITGVKTVPGDRLLRQPKGIIRITGYDIHEDYVKLGRMIPVNYFNRLGTVNSLAFPQHAYRDQNQAGDVPVQLRPGTCLLLKPRITSHTQMHPAVLAGQIDANYFPRTVDVETNILYFNPPTTETSTIDLSAATYGPGSATQVIYGHNLTGVPIPSNTAPHVGTQWFAARRFSGPLPDVPGNPTSDTQLLHRYSNFEKLWGSVESL